MISYEGAYDTYTYVRTLAIVLNAILCQYHTSGSMMSYEGVYDIPVLALLRSTTRRPRSTLDWSGYSRITKAGWHILR